MLRIKLTFCILAIVLSGLSSCSRSPDCFREEIFCAALVTDTRGINDHGINQDSWIGLEQSKVNGVIDQSAYIESVDARDYEKNIAFFANSGYDVILTSGIERSADIAATLCEAGPLMKKPYSSQDVVDRLRQLAAKARRS